MAMQKVWNMSKLAKGQSERWIRQQYNAAIKAANDRIKTITKPEHAGRAQAYEYYVKGDLAGAPYVKQRHGQTVFKALPRGADRETSLEALRMVERFLGGKTSTASGIRETQRERHAILNKMLEEDYKMRKGEDEEETESSAPKLTHDEAEEILKWMGSEEGKAAKADYDSNQVREGVAKAVIAQREAAKEAAKQATKDNVENNFIMKSVVTLYKEWNKSHQTLADWIQQSENQIGYSKM